MKSTPARYVDGQIHAYQVSGPECGPLQPTTTYKVESPNNEDVTCAVGPNQDYAVYTTPHSVVCINQDGKQFWRYNLEPRSTMTYIPNASCVFSLDGTWVWVYRPDAEADRGPDILVVLRAETGEEVARTELETVGEGSKLVLHPDGKHILLDVDEGQDGAKVFRAAFTPDAGIILHPYGWNDRCLIDVSPDGGSFMTVDHGQDNVVFHAFPSGEEVLSISIEDLGYELDEDSGFMKDEACIDWNGGFLDADLAVVTISGEKDDEEWHCHYSIDLLAGVPLNLFEGYSQNNYDFEPLGDGTWIVFDSDSNVVRHRYGKS